jgi:hypothetical protein
LTLSAFCLPLLLAACEKERNESTAPLVKSV